MMHKVRVAEYLETGASSVQAWLGPPIRAPAGTVLRVRAQEHLLVADALSGSQHHWFCGLVPCPLEASQKVHVPGEAVAIGHSA